MSRYYYRTLTFVFLLISGLVYAGPNIYLYILEFDNIQNDPATDWLRTGFVDIIREKIDTGNQIKLKNRDDLEEVMNNRTLLLHQPRGSKNLLILGKYDRILEELKVSIQMIDIATWQELDSRKLVGVFAEIPALGTTIAETINTMLLSYLPPPKKPRKYPDFATPYVKEPPPKFSERSQGITESIDIAIDLLEESMDLAIGAREKVPERNEDAIGEWELDLNVDNQYGENPENEPNTEMLVKVIDNLTKTPYKVRLSKPKFEYDKENDSIMLVTFPVTYSLKDNIIKDMLTTLPYSGLKQDGSLTIFYFNKDKFNFPSNIFDKIKYGSYRAVPVIQFFDESGTAVVVIADSPDATIQSNTSSKVKFVPTHRFSPLIDFTIGGWSLQIAMETVDIKVNYRFTLDLDKVDELSRVNLKFVSVEELHSFLADIL